MPHRNPHVYVRTMVRDRRDPTQWYTLWAVLFIGSISLVVSFAQLALAAVQVAYAIEAVASPPSGQTMGGN